MERGGQNFLQSRETYNGAFFSEYSSVKIHSENLLIFRMKVCFQNETVINQLVPTVQLVPTATLASRKYFIEYYGFATYKFFL